MTVLSQCRWITANTKKTKAYDMYQEMCRGFYASPVFCMLLSVMAQAPFFQKVNEGV